MRLKFAGLFIISLVLFSCVNNNKTKLIVIIVADQMRPDHFTRFDKLYNGGIRWLIDNGIFFDSAYQQHAVTHTGPGHFSIGSGKYPGPAGILGNSYYDRSLDKVVNCVEDPNCDPIGGKGVGRSISRYKTKMIGDFIKESHPSSKVYSIAGKDRSSILLAGINPDLVLYYNNLDKFISSSYYVDSLPEWLGHYNDSLDLSNYKDSLWTKIFPDSIYLKYSREDYFFGEVDSYHAEHSLINKPLIVDNNYNPVFPISFDKDEDPGKEFLGSPWFDDILFGLGKKIIQKERLGTDDNPDLLFIGLSAMDYIIHSYGPFSQESMDYMLRLDKQLESLITYIDNCVGLNNVEFVFTSDHGGLPLPEYLPRLGEIGGRINRENLSEAYGWIEDEIREQFGEGLYFRHGTNYYFYHDKLELSNISIDEPIKIIKKYLSMVDGIDSVIAKDEIIKSNFQDPITIRLKNMIHENNSPDVIAIKTYGYLYHGPYGTSHGTPYNYDANVPLLFSSKGKVKRNSKIHAETVDIAPTVLNMLNINSDYDFDGEVLSIE